MKMHKLALGLMIAGMTWSASAAEGEPREATFDLKFPGGSPADLVEAIGKITVKPNLLVAPSLEKLNLPPMELHAVDTKTVFNSLNAVLVYSDLAARLTLVDNVWVLQGPRDSRRSQVFYVGHLLAKYKIEDVTTAIQSAWKMAGKAPNADLKYHQDTQLLMALAETQQLQTITEVLGELSKGLVEVRVPTNDEKKAKPNKAP
jgi:hypothetical protein